MTTWFAVDIGGTFTDFVIYDEASGLLNVAKVLSTPDALERAIEDLIEGETLGVSISDASYFIQGTTVGLNTILERTGPTLGQLATRGFRDVLELRRGKRDEMYNLFWHPPQPLIPRRLRLPVSERTTGEGRILHEVEPIDIREATQIFTANGVESVAVAFINSYANPKNELVARDLLQEFGYEGEVSLSHEVSSEYREFERTSTTVIDAYVRPQVNRFLKGLDNKLKNLGFSGLFLITRCGGGLITLDEATRRPFETIQSGPVAGAMGAAEICRHLGIKDAIAADVGGTSFETCLIANSKLPMKFSGEVADLPIQAPWVDVHSIGTGGGSLAWIDEGGLLRVGPRSAGSNPGPASYGWGGLEATVTDAAVALGMLGHTKLAGGITLDHELAIRALKPLAERLSKDPIELAIGVITIMSASMANAIREATVQKGHDPRGAVLIAFGGAGPLFATHLARELGISTILIPPHPGNFSAWGLLSQDIMQTYSKSIVLPLDDHSIDLANDEIASLFERLAGVHGASLGGKSEEREVALDLRYRGQEYSLTIPVPSTDGRIEHKAVWIVDEFNRRYEEVYGHLLGTPIELVAVRATSRLRLAKPALVASLTKVAGDANKSAADEVRTYSYAAGRWIPFALIERTSIQVGDRLEGPAIITEPTSTTYLDSGFSLLVDESGNVAISAQRKVD